MENECIFGGYVYSAKVVIYSELFLSGFGNDTALLTSINLVLSPLSLIFSQRIEAKI